MRKQIATALLAIFAALPPSRAQTPFADLRDNYATTGTPLTDSFGTGNWVYYASTTANPSQGTLTALTYGSVGDASHDGYGDAGHDSFSVPAVSNSNLFTDGASTGTTFLAWHPGNDSPEFTVIQWTAGTGEAGAIDISGIFSRVDDPNPPAGDGPNFYIVVNGVQVYSDLEVGSASDPFNVTSDILPGETVDFVLGPGAAGYGGNESDISGAISAIPEPSTYAAIFGVLALGAAGAQKMRRRRAIAA